ncbi:MAG: hypothetical protein A3I07_00945 [Candidatus Doudnabacteria bacterium RIFCSPLOWO2_02_FULL_42_9]|uniref:Uncharacterized protein n=1 Tax=Candidatus Doudnabacteria bacterium RIFCSPHIGHO2_01_FULL_41_86 TaxID=1817821 RepID=A0A1F5N9E8_9BACT|nr:MAG: hypothetical protein A2717_01600 [Candidatus Doudnabacteria bacterium RIFCSPHIGHO2_01_FULL_41_86]OGE75030.1 MAG: hypothetical protein A3K07_04650 [Candidatus Doudnabacteria bacterium RIFCSPHIGHO2_01_43_10]OGE85263.1 MAG: hypothetical protein A3E28_01170 [Candidatus Doudnabacteria bacterium RIFCSPHIGHO2_12_FULL_42_22]OGE86801.1 MAG: hypothetical protein A3C49_02005 [Candidatus Doudnabacteria bacterium RIFCSPHIGHO2_02_FULL_42_25]OGE92400.1 MAG: hypothetical protein A2895_02160 [Candidatus
MTDLTKEYLDKSLKNLPTKQEVDTIVNTAVDSAVENLAKVINDGFQAQQDFLIEKLDVSERVAQLENDMTKIKEALHIK